MCEFSHVAIQINEHIYEATFKNGVSRTTFNEFTSRYSDREMEILHPDRPGERAAKEWLDKQVGKGYDFTGLVAVPLLRDWQDENKWFCSELIARALIEAGVLHLRYPVSGISVRDLVIGRKMRWFL
jgi:uncharacterized protein YycO